MSRQTVCKELQKRLAVFLRCGTLCELKRETPRTQKVGRNMENTNARMPSMTYEEMIATRAERAVAAAARKAEWLKNADVDQMEIDEQERREFVALAD